MAMESITESPAPLPIRRSYHSRNTSQGWHPTHNVSRSFSSHFGAYPQDGADAMSRSPPNMDPSSFYGISCSPVDHAFDLEQSFFSDFTCCGRSLQNMHDLVSHFEESHVMVYDSTGKPIYIPAMSVPGPMSMATPYATYTTTTMTTTTHLPSIATSSISPSSNSVVNAATSSPTSPNSSIPPSTPSTPACARSVSNLNADVNAQNSSAMASPVLHHQNHHQQHQHQMEMAHGNTYTYGSTQNGDVSVSVNGGDHHQHAMRGFGQVQAQAFAHTHLSSPPPRISINTTQVTATAYRFPQTQSASSPPPPQSFNPVHDVSSVAQQRLQPFEIHAAYPYYCDTSSASASPSSPSTSTTVCSPAATSSFVTSPHAHHTRFGFNNGSCSNVPSLYPSSNSSDEDEHDVLVDFDPMDANAHMHPHISIHGHGHSTVPQSPVCLPPSSFSSSPVTEYEYDYTPALSRRTSVEDLQGHSARASLSNNGYLAPSLERSHSSGSISLPFSAHLTASLSRKSSASSVSSSRKGSLSTPTRSKSKSKSKGQIHSGPKSRPSVSAASAAAHAARLSFNVTESKRKSDATSFMPKKFREKAYKCPIEGCTKSYLNPNGLKYHMTKGKCNILNNDASPSSPQKLDGDDHDEDEDHDLDADADGDEDVEFDVEGEMEGEGGDEHEIEF